MKLKIQIYLVYTLPINYTYDLSCVYMAKCVIQRSDNFIFYVIKYFMFSLLMVEAYRCTASRNTFKVLNWLLPVG